MVAIETLAVLEEVEVEFDKLARLDGFAGRVLA
jgi:hypothetical protein